MTYAQSNRLIDDNGETLAEFPSHWEAVAAMLRLSNPGFRSLGGDKPDARHVEDEMRRRMDLPAIQWERS